MPVVSMRFFPSIDDKLEASVSGVSYNLSFMRSKVDRLDRELVSYLNSSSKNFLDYQIVKSSEFLEPAGNYSQMLATNNLDKSICDYVDKDGVKEFWIWMYKTDDLLPNGIAPIKFNLSMGKKSQKFWNKTGSGNIASEVSAPELPTCESSYTVYEYNWNQETEDALYNHVRDLEAILKFIDDKDSPLFWQNFVGADSNNRIVKPGCGWSDMPPNAVFEGDYENQKSVLSDCMDWKPDGTGGKQPIACSAWGCTSLGFYTWYLQNIPGKDNTLSIENRKLRNWWEFIADFDYAITGGKSLTTILLAYSPKPSAVLGVSVGPSPSPSPSVAAKTVTINIYFPTLNSKSSEQVYVLAAGKNLGSVKIENQKAVIKTTPQAVAMCTKNPGCDLVLKTDRDLSVKLGTAVIPADSTYILEFTATGLIRGDLNKDDVINSADAAIVTNNYGKPGATDLNNDGITDEKDLQVLMENYGKAF